MLLYNMLQSTKCNKQYNYRVTLDTKECNAIYITFVTNLIDAKKIVKIKNCIDIVRSQIQK